jgi:hypothetical protein
MTSQQCCRSRNCSSQYIKKVRPVWKKFGQFGKRSANFPKTSLQSSAGATIRNENGRLSLPLCVCHYCRIKNFFRKFSSTPFLPLLGTFGQILAMNSSGQLFFFSAPYELFGQNFGHLAILRHSWRDGGVGGGLSALHKEFFQNRRGTRNCMTFWP